MKVLFVESNIHGAKSTHNALINADFNITIASNHEDALYMMTHFDFDAILMNEDLSEANGVQVVRKARLIGVHTPIILFTKKSSSKTVVEALVAGADDYLVYAIQAGELRARIEAVVRRSRGIPSSVVQIGKLAVDVHKHCASVGGTPLNLTRKEYELLEALVVRKGRPVDKESLMNIIYGHEDEPNIKIIDVFICKLRKKLDFLLDGEPVIETIWGRGYMIRDVNENIIDEIPATWAADDNQAPQPQAIEPWMTLKSTATVSVHA